MERCKQRIALLADARETVKSNSYPLMLVKFAPSPTQCHHPTQLL